MKLLIISAFIGVVIGILASSFVGFFKKSYIKKRAKITYCITKSGTYKLTISKNKKEGFFIFFKEKEDLIKYLKKYPSNALLKITSDENVPKECTCIGDFISSCKSSTYKK